VIYCSWLFYEQLYLIYIKSLSFVEYVTFKIYKQQQNVMAALLSFVLPNKFENRTFFWNLSILYSNLQNKRKKKDFSRLLQSLHRGGWPKRSGFK